MSRVLLAVIGETPQILTEIIYSFYYNNPDFKFDKITVLTTTLGLEKIVNSIFQRKILDCLVAALNRSTQDVPFSRNDIIVFKDSSGQELFDIRSDAEIQNATLQFYTTLQLLTKDNTNQVIATIAGGRKNMGAALALGMQLFGRPQDRLIHVLVKKQHENSDWFFPQSVAEAQDIEISDIPFIRIRSYLPTQKLINLHPKDLLHLAQYSLDANAPVRSLEILDNKFIIDGFRLRLPPHQAMIIRFLARQKTHYCQCPERLECGDCYACFVDIKTTMVTYWNSPEYYQEYINIASGMGFIERRREVGEITAEQIRSHISKTKKMLQEQLPSFRLQQNFQILSFPDPRDKDRRLHLTGLSVDKNAIKWRD